jgi:hypothetical protein
MSAEQRRGIHLKIGSIGGYRTAGNAEFLLEAHSKCNKNVAGETKRLRRQGRQGAPGYELGWKLKLTVLAEETLFYPCLNNLKQAGIFQVGAGFFIGKVVALPGPGLMDGAAFAQTVVGQQDAGAVFPGFKSVFVFQEAAANLTVVDAQMPGQTVDVFGVEIER